MFEVAHSQKTDSPFAMANESSQLESLPPPYSHCGGLSWYAVLPSHLAEGGDTNAEPTSSRLALFEDGAPLGPRHALHAGIENQGRGRYSHWINVVYFSTSDGTDPNTNGRQYSAKFSEPAPNFLGFGSCHAHAALADLAARGLANSLWSIPALSYSPLETLHRIDVYLDDMPLPKFLLQFSKTEQAASSLRSIIDATDGVFIELGSSIDIMCDSVCVPRSQIMKGVIEPLAALGGLERRAVFRWYHQGLMRRNDELCLAMSEQLIKLLARTELDADITSEILRRARGVRQDDQTIIHTLDRIRDRLGNKSFYVISAQNAFLPDGRPVSWPGNFPKDLRRICGDLKLPLLDTSSLVVERGTAFSLQSDLHHFTPEFLSYLGDRMVTMARNTLDNP